MKILIVSQYFWPEHFRINDLAITLQQLGNEVSVLTGLPNYPKGHYYQGYSKTKNNDEKWQNISIYRCNMRPRGQGSLQLVRNYLSYAYQAIKKSKILEEQNFDLLYVFGVSPLTSALPAIYLKKKWKIPIILNVQDLWPEYVTAITGLKNSLCVCILDKLMRYIYRSCDKILISSKSYEQSIQRYLGTSSDKIMFWPQYATVEKVAKSKVLFDEMAFHIVFTGNIGEAQGLDIAIETADMLKDFHVQWHFIGTGRYMTKLVAMVKQRKLEKCVIFHGWIPETQVPQYLASADAALLILKDDDVFKMALPAKLQTYMACGVPIVGCVKGESKRILLEAEAGIVTDEISAAGLTSVCKQFLTCPKERYDRLCKNALAYGKAHFDKQVLIEQLIKEMRVLKDEHI